MSRRSKGEGTEWRDKTTGHWRWRIRHEKQEYYVHDPDRARAREKRDQLRAQLNKKIKLSDARQSLTDYLEYWLDAAVRRNVSESTLHAYRKKIELYIIAPLGGYRLADLDAHLILKWVNATRDNYALSSARQALSLLRRALANAVRERILEYNAAGAITLPPALRLTDDTDEDGQRALSPEQQALILADVKRHDAYQTKYDDKRFNQSAGMYLLYSLAFGLGLRRGELLGLRRQDIKLDQRVLYVRQQVIRLDGTHRISKTLKTKAAKRDLPLTDDLIALLRPHLLRLGGGEAALLFPAKDGGPLRPDTLTRHFARACKRCGLVGYSLHDARHTAITRWRTAGVDAETTAAIAGHETPQITLGVYSSVDMARKRAAVERSA